MKKHNLLFIFISLSLTFSACEEHEVHTGTVINEDGTLERRIKFFHVDSTLIEQNYFGINEASGWTVKFEPQQSDAPSARKNLDKLNTVFTKRFGSAEDSNAALDNTTDTLFHIHSTFKKEFYWFYSYIHYTDTYRAINRFRYTDSKEYLTKKDQEFIDRLPAEGTDISKEDSLFADQLSEKIIDDFAGRAIFDEHIEVIKELIIKYEIGSQWLDSLKTKEEGLYEKMLSDKKNDDPGLSIIDSLKIPFDPEVIEVDYKKAISDYQARYDFMSKMAACKFSHNIEMPWTIIRTNADTISGNVLGWNPPVIKLLLKDYIMYAEARKMNYWAIIISVATVLFGAVIFLKRKS